MPQTVMAPPTCRYDTVSVCPRENPCAGIWHYIPDVGGIQTAAHTYVRTSWLVINLNGLRQTVFSGGCILRSPW